jgi:hypothetical protein
MEDVRSAWNEVGDRLVALGLKLKLHAEEELSVPEGAVDDECARVRKAIEGVVDAFVDAAKDPAVKGDVKATATALSDALDATATAVRQRVRAA